MTLNERFEQFEGEFLKFDRIENPRSRRADLHAFLLLDELQPPEGDGTDIISNAEHDQFWIDIDCEKLNAITDAQILELVRCGVMCDEDLDGLSMFT